MKKSFKLEEKARILQIFNKIKRKFEQANKIFSFNITDVNPLDGMFEVEYPNQYSSIIDGFFNSYHKTPNIKQK